jgi:hypothetical protein
MSSIKKCFFAAMLFAVSTGVVRAEGVAIGGRVGTTGLGGDLTVRLHERVNVRGSGSWMSWNVDGTVDDVDFTYGLDYEMYGALIDLHPFANGFRLSGGAFWGSSSTTLDSKLSNNQKIGDHEYTPEQIGTLKGKIDFERTPAPYIGIGYGNAVDPNQSFTFIFDLGVVFQSYKVTLSADGAAAQSRQFQNDLKQLESDTQDKVDDFKIYPVISVGMAYQF